MHDQEWNELIECCDCGATINTETDRGYAVNDVEQLCFACAVRRGGSYDIGHETWAVPPDVTGIPDERRSHANP